MGGNKTTWHVTVKEDQDDPQGTQDRWQAFCEEFMSEDILIVRRYMNNVAITTCQMSIDPFQPIDSTHSMPSFIDQALAAGFRLHVETPI